MEETKEIYSERKYIIEFNHFTDDAYDNFIKQANESIEQPYRELLLSSNGGSPYFINSMKRVLEKGDFSMVGYDRLFSAGFLLFMYTDVEKTVLKDTISGFHYPSMVGIETNPNNSIYASTKLEKTMQEREVYDVDFFRDLLKITNNQHKKLMSSKDEWLIFDYKQTQKLADKSRKMLSLQ